MQFHILSFEVPDEYARIGGLATRVIGLAETLVDLGHEVHLWFVGEPDLPGHEVRDGLHLHRWCQWVSQHHPGGVYDGEIGKAADYNASLPPYMVHHYLAPHLDAGGRAVILAEEWQTADAVLHLHWLLKYAGLRDRVSLLWNANNIFGFERIAWERMTEASTVTTVSRYMKQRMHEWGVDPLVIPNGLDPSSYAQPTKADVEALRSRFRGQTVLAKMARWDPDKRWLGAVELVAEMKRQGWRPLLVARGGSEPHGQEVLTSAQERGLRVVDRVWDRPGFPGLLGALEEVGDADVVNLRSFVDAGGRRVLFRAADAVLANSRHEPFGLVGLEAMAVGGLACTGSSGEDYAVPGHNALVLETDDPWEFMSMFDGLRQQPEIFDDVRRSGRATARRYTWRRIVERVLLPRASVAYADSEAASAEIAPRTADAVSSELAKAG